MRRITQLPLLPAGSLRIELASSCKALGIGLSLDADAGTSGGRERKKATNQQTYTSIAL